jgi:ABC-2 type transport system ATP-binding protein
MTPVIEARGLRKRFGKTTALDGLDLVAERGQVFAVLGPNGAGKTTFVRAVATLLGPDSGSLQVCGYDVRKHPGRVRQLIGLAGQFAAVEPVMTGRENVFMVARLYGMSRPRASEATASVLTTLGLMDAADRPVKTYSGGMRRRLDLGASLVGAPQLLLLDEPTTGLDPGSRSQLWDAIRQLVTRGTDVLMTTQYLDEAERLADRIAIIDHGVAIASGTPSELKATAGGNVIEIGVREREDLASVAEILGRIGSEEPRLDPNTNRATVTVAPGEDGIAAAVQAVSLAGVAIDDIGLRRPTLDEVFFMLTGTTTGPTPEDEPANPPAHAGARRASEAR